MGPAASPGAGDRGLYKSWSSARVRFGYTRATEVQAKYEGYINKQYEQVQRFEKWKAD